MDGVLVVDKPQNITSHDVVARVRRISGVRRVGHIGTLDPIATGVLPLVIGQATRLASLLAVGPKVYEGLIRLGLSTDTYDITGTVVTDSQNQSGSGPVRPPSEKEIREIAARFSGTFMQTPPPFSAKKIKGVRAYRLARHHKPVKPEAVEVTVHELNILDITGSHIRCRVNCEPGFYMRSLAHDLGISLGCGACLETLRREQSGTFRLQQSTDLGRLENIAPDLERHLLPISELLPDLPKLVVTTNGKKRTSHGNDLSRADILSADREWRTGLVRLCNDQGALLAIAKADEALILHPMIVLV